ncbi:hypothetical protein [Longimicrobium terrae]|uniref:Uncharacterized protein n=1 Tax=Longimicrobium terrae TaxID=1639882 RepID=A0A841GXH1_9BACT|nr:hypothetical protein [Longimicrobium terrae]MBB4636000.1 hypothetical protein [Longimicrobium terrae]MBB6070396.1 hypothetical protein [Longimicrobium terrae]NNC30890.1 hypothetical protein [Longimicrobium terrae]
MKLYAIAACWLIATAALPATAQQAAPDQPFASREQFLTAPLAEVRRRVGAISPTDSSIVDRFTRRAIPRLSEFFRQTPDVFWAAEGQGTFARSDAIGVDRSQILALRLQMGLEAFPDLIEFVLAHEFAHVAQFGLPDPATRAGPSNFRARECEADIWAGIRAERFLVDSLLSRSPPSSPIRPSWIPSTVAGVFSRMLTAVSVAYQIGHPAWYGPPESHPTRMERRACAMQGLQIGLQLRSLRSYHAEVDSATKAYYASQVKDTALFRGEAGTWATTWQHATRLVAARSIRVTADTVPPLVHSFVALLKAASVSGDSLRRIAMPAGMLGPDNCAFTSSDSASTFTCVYREAAWSMQMFTDFFGSMHLLVAVTARHAGWESVKWTTRPSWFDEWAPKGLGRAGTRTGGLVTIRGNNGFTGNRFVEVVVTSPIRSARTP